jgi:protein required for attachment to host cells
VEALKLQEDPSRQDKKSRKETTDNIEIEDDAYEYEVEKILKKRIHNGRIELDASYRTP